jgi:hypothetical protein
MSPAIYDGRNTLMRRNLLRGSANLGHFARRLRPTAARSYGLSCKTFALMINPVGRYEVPGPELRNGEECLIGRCLLRREWVAPFLAPRGGGDTAHPDRR